MKHSDYVKAMLLASIHELAADPSIYAKNPGRDFSRNRKMGFRDFLLMFLTMEADCIKEELYRYFGRSTAAPSKAAFYKQRKKLRDDAFRWLLLSFNKKCRKLLFKDKYSLVACDGSAADIFRNPGDPDTFFEPSGKSTKGFSQIHINAMFSILDKKFIDLVIQPARKRNEYSAFCQMVDQNETESTCIYICDRGFASYNNFSHVIENGQFFLIRCTDAKTEKLLGFSLDGVNALDYSVDRILSRSQSKKKRLRPELAEQYRYVCPAVPLDYITRENPEYKLQWIGIKQCDIVSIHYESTYQVQRVLDWLKPYGCKRFLAINPATPIYVLEEVLDYIDGINLLMVNPGFAGQKIIPSTLKKAEKLQEFLLRNGRGDILVEVDGNITPEYGAQLQKSGAELFVGGTSSIFRGSVTQYRDNIRHFRTAIH